MWCLDMGAHHPRWVHPLPLVPPLVDALPSSPPLVPRGRCTLYRSPSATLIHSNALYLPAANHVSGVMSLKRSVLFVHNHPPQQRLGSDRRLLAIVGQVKRLGWDVSYAGADDFDPGPVTGRSLLKDLGVPMLSPVASAEALSAFARAHEASVIVLCLCTSCIPPLVDALPSSPPLVPRGRQASSSSASGFGGSRPPPRATCERCE